MILRTRVRSHRRTTPAVSRRIATALLAAGGIVIGGLGLAETSQAAFSQCPAIGADTGCGILLTIAANGAVSAASDAAQGPYDGIDDTLIGVQNNASQSVPSLHLSGTSSPPPFEFDGDGICSGSFIGTPVGCPFGPTGYEGPNTSFANIAADTLSGDIVFTGGLAGHSSAYFSLEGAITAMDLVLTPVTPGGGTIILIGNQSQGNGQAANADQAIDQSSGGVTTVGSGSQNAANTSNSNANNSQRVGSDGAFVLIAGQSAQSNGQMMGSTQGIKQQMPTSWLLLGGSAQGGTNTSVITVGNSSLIF